jgi:hypothetical protein
MNKLPSVYLTMIKGVLGLHLELLIMEPQTDLTVAKNASVKRASA